MMRSLEDKAAIFGSIFTLSNRLQILGDKMDPQLTVKQWLFLAGILKCESPAPTLSEVAGQIGSSRQNVKKIAAILEKQGFVWLEKDAADGRMLRIRLTDGCMRHLQEREEMELHFIKELFAGFAGEELSAFSGLLRKLEGNVRKMGSNDEEKEM